MLGDLFIDDWALKRFAGVSNLPARPRALSKRKLAPYEGLYTGQTIDPPGTKPGDTVTQTTRIELQGTSDGRLRMALSSTVGSEVLGASPDIVGAEDAPAAGFSLAFYRDDYVLVLDESGEPFVRANFLRGHDGSVVWLRFGGRLFRHQGVK